MDSDLLEKYCSLPVKILDEKSAQESPEANGETTGERSNYRLKSLAYLPHKAPDSKKVLEAYNIDVALENVSPAILNLTTIE